MTVRLTRFLSRKRANGGRCFPKSPPAPERPPYQSAGCGPSRPRRRCPPAFPLHHRQAAHLLAGHELGGGPAIVLGRHRGAPPGHDLPHQGLGGGPSSAATQRSTISRSVTMPRSFRSSPHTGARPRCDGSGAGRPGRGGGGLNGDHTGVHQILNLHRDHPFQTHGVLFLSVCPGPAFTIPAIL